MPNALPQPAELRGHLIIARCGEGARRTSPVREKTPGQPHRGRSVEKRPQGEEEERGEWSARQSGKQTGRNDDASLSSAYFFN